MLSGTKEAPATETGALKWGLNAGDRREPAPTLAERAGRRGVPYPRQKKPQRACLEEAGKLIGANDLLIAAHALALDHTLVTDNEREFLTDRRCSSRKLVALTLVVCGEAGTQQKNSDVDSIRQIRSAIDPSRPFTAILRYSAARHWSACANLRLLDRLEHIFPAFRRSANRAKTCRQRELISGAR